MKILPRIAIAVAEELMAFKFSAAQMYDRLYVGIPVADMKCLRK